MLAQQHAQNQLAQQAAVNQQAVIAQSAAIQRHQQVKLQAAQLAVTAHQTQPQIAAQPALPPPTMPAGWHPDPTARHRHRYWDGTRWTNQVADNGIPGTDPV
ncbi:MAG: DUF2510 domain-containing protein [Actinobacteria bacterium]|nr:DUF2510 domain-containing protein [Actinomycetota bacterium]